MDPLGNVLRDFMKQAHLRQVKTALGLALELRQESMAAEQIEEMLYSSGFEQVVVDDAMTALANKRGTK